MTITHPAIAIAAIGFMLVAAVCDIRSRRISNRLNLAGLGLALVLQFYLGGSAGIAAAASGVAAGLAALFVPFVGGMIGGGDVKFAATSGAFLGWKLLLIGLVAGVLLGGITGAISLAKHRRFATAMRGLFADLLCIATGVRPTTLKSSETVETIPYGVVLAIGMSGVLGASLLRWIS